MSEIQYWKQDLGKHEGTFQKFVAEIKHDKQNLGRSYYTEGRRTTFTLTKMIEYPQEDIQEKLSLKVEWLDRLQKDSFNRVRIPRFEYEILSQPSRTTGREGLPGRLRATPSSAPSAQLPLGSSSPSCTGSGVPARAAATCGAWNSSRTGCSKAKSKSGTRREYAKSGFVAP